MPVWDYAQMPAAPGGASYAPAPIDFSALARLPAAVEAGQERAVQQGMRNMFPGGTMPLTQDGQPDYSEIVRRAMSIGGPAAAQPYMQMALQQANQPGNMAALGGGIPGGQPATGPQATAAPSRTNGPATGSDHLDTSTSQSGQPAPNTVRGMLSAGLPQERADALTPVMAQRMGVHPDDPLNDDQIQFLRGRFTDLQKIQVAQNQRPRGGPPFAQGTPSQRSPVQQQPTVQQADTNQDTAVTSNAREAQGQQQPTQQQPIRRPPPDPQMVAEYQRLRAERDFNLQQAARPGQTPGAIQSLKDHADALSKEMQSIFDTLQKNQELTGSEKELTSGTTRQTALDKQTIDQSGKTWEGIQAGATQYERDVNPVTTLAHGILSDPQMYTGIGAQASLNFNKIRDIFGAPRAAALQQGLEKINAITTLGAVNQQRDQLMEAGGASARIFSQQIEQVVKSNPNLENTVWGNRMLINIMDRIGQRQVQIRDMALDYRKAHGGILDDDFTKQVAQYVKANPAFTKEEAANPTILGAPELPGTIRTPEQLTAWKQAQGLKSGDPYRDPTGQIRHVK